MVIAPKIAFELFPIAQYNVLGQRQIVIGSGQGPTSYFSRLCRLFWPGPTQYYLGWRRIIPYQPRCPVIIMGLWYTLSTCIFTCIKYLLFKRMQGDLTGLKYECQA